MEQNQRYSLFLILQIPQNLVQILPTMHLFLRQFVGRLVSVMLKAANVAWRACSLQQSSNVWSAHFFLTPYQQICFRLQLRLTRVTSLEVVNLFEMNQTDADLHSFCHHLAEHSACWEVILSYLLWRFDCVRSCGSKTHSAATASCCSFSP